MQQGCNWHVAQAICSLFNSARDADCEIVFYLEEKVWVGAESPTFLPRPGSDGDEAPACTRILLGEPLPAHQFVLRYASERFGAQLARWSQQEENIDILQCTSAITDVTAHHGQPSRMEILQEQQSNVVFSMMFDQQSVASAEEDAAPFSPPTPPEQQQRPSMMAKQDAFSTDETLIASSKESHSRPADLECTPASESTPALARASAIHRLGNSREPPRLRLVSSGGLPKLFIPLGSADEVPSARAAIRFAYSGEVVADSIREVLEMRRQGAYLQISGCTAACDDVIQRKLITDAMGKLAELSGCEAQSGRSSSSSGDQSSAVLELFVCEALWPDLEEEPSFADMAEMAKRLLVAHFRTSLLVLNTPSLLDQLLGLRAVGLEALLESNDFSTDSESSVLLLLATWMEANYEQTDVETRQRLCRTIRLAHLSRPYLSLVLPALAADHEKDPGSLPGWFPLDVMQAAFLTGFANATVFERKKLLDANSSTGVRSPDFPYYSLRVEPRRQCIHSSGLSFRWYVSQLELQAQLQHLPAGAQRRCYGTFENGEPGVIAWGLFWRVSLIITGGAPAAGLFIWCELPQALRVPGSRLSQKGGPTAVTQFVAQVAVHRRLGDTEVRFGPEDYLDVGLGLGWPQILYLLPQREAPDAGGGGGDPLAAWRDYLQDGKVSGTLTLLPPEGGS
ncbi:hypothetical protein Vafri_8529 [Volvox africanus]|nr:hypothetical protein Vafri_8529 [Volvox africanus]